MIQNITGNVGPVAAAQGEGAQANVNVTQVGDPKREITNTNKDLLVSHLRLQKPVRFRIYTAQSEESILFTRSLKETLKEGGWILIDSGISYSQGQGISIEYAGPQEVVVPLANLLGSMGLGPIVCSPNPYIAQGEKGVDVRIFVEVCK